MQKAKTKAQDRARSKQRPVRRRPNAADRRADAVNVAWMLCLLATCLAELLGLIAGLGIWAQPDRFPQPLRAIPGLLLFTAFITGGCVLLLTPLAYRFSQTRPPTAITAFATVVALLPVLVYIWQVFQ